MSEDKAEGRDAAPSMNPKERPDLEDYKNKDKGLHQHRILQKQLILIQVLLFLHQKEMYKIETKLEIPLEDNKENVKSETKSPKVKTLSEEEPSITTVSKEELSQRSDEVQNGNTTES